MQTITRDDTVLTYWTFGNASAPALLLVGDVAFDAAVLPFLQTHLES